MSRSEQISVLSAVWISASLYAFVPSLTGKQRTDSPAKKASTGVFQAMQIHTLTCEIHEDGLSPKDGLDFREAWLCHSRCPAASIRCPAGVPLRSGMTDTTDCEQPDHCMKMIRPQGTGCSPRMFLQNGGVPCG